MLEAYNKTGNVLEMTSSVTVDIKWKSEKETLGGHFSNFTGKIRICSYSPRSATRATGEKGLDRGKLLHHRCNGQQGMDARRI